jgi:peptide methionine sulfoxide reductase msrA/msrB
MMNKIYLITILMIILAWGTGCAQNNKQDENAGKYNQLTPAEERVIIHKGTERPFTGKYDKFYEEGTYICKRCGAELYRSEDKFDSGCGWPSFDDEVPGAVKRVPDGFRTEIICSNCDGHLGHVFLGEGFTDKNTRHCVNSISMDFIPVASQDTAYFAGGCFWGVEHFMEEAEGVISAVSGYMGGSKKNPSYRQVSNHTTGHAEAVRVIFDSSKVGYEELAKLFFEIHDPTQVNRQGPDIGEQYRSEIFYKNEEQKMLTEKLIGILKTKGYKIATKVTPANEFWEAEDYHQDYYAKKNGTPYCHAYTKRF